ncbi:MAG: AsmA family protein, partial [Candidatus Gastranaerophilales bacterium]|nr:AsmA family protein [Candidatus Gastranaerophilales bacterium]
MISKYKNILISLSVVLLGAVLAIQTLPFFINGNQFKDTLYKSFEESTDLKLNVRKISVSSEPFLKAKVSLEKPFIQTKTGENVFYSDKASVSVNILPLIFKRVEITDIKLQSPDVYIIKGKDGKFNFEKKKDGKKESEFDVSFNGLDVIANNYRLEYLDKTAPQKVDTKAKGHKFEFLDYNSPFGTKLNTDGVMAINDVRCLNYNIKTKIDIPAFLEYEEEKDPLTSTEESSNINPLYELYKNGLKANLIADLKIKTPQDIEGEALLEKLSIKVGEKRLPDSRLHIKAKKDKYIVNAKLYITPDGIIDLTGDFKKDFVNFKLKTSNMQLSEVQNFLKIVSHSMGKPVQILDKLDLKGNLIADLKLKSDMKTIQSYGFFNIKNSQINYDKGLFIVKNFNSDIRLDNNNINIQNTSGTVDGNKISIIGKIDSKANTDIKLFVPSVNIKTILSAPQTKEKLANVSQINGKAAAIIHLTGKLEQLKYQGYVTLSNMNILLKDTPAKISFPKANIDIDKDKALIKIPNFYLNKSLFSLQGTAPMNNGKINLNAQGKLKASDIADILNTSSVGKGEVPTICNILIDKQNVALTVQMLNNPYNNILIEGIGSNSILNAKLDINGKKTKLTDVALYKTGQNHLSANPNANLSDTTKIATATGLIKKIGTHTVLDDIKIKVIRPIKISIPIGQNATSNITGDATINGTTTNPAINGDFILSNTTIPELKGTITKTNIAFRDKKITADIYGFASGRTNFNAKTNMDIRSLDPAVIETVTINANTFDLDQMSALASKLLPERKPIKTQYSLKQNNAMHLNPIVIKDGKFNAKRLILNGVYFNDFNSNIKFDRYNIFKITDITSNAMKGSIAGNVEYDAITSQTSLNLKAKDIDVDLFGNKILGLPMGQISGIGSSNVKISFIGSKPDEITKSLHGVSNFIVKNGEMGDLGRMDFYLRAANILSNNLL